MSILVTPLNVYLVQVLDAAPDMQSTMSIILQVPWALKLVFGFMSDALPVAGSHRKPYLCMGALLYSSMFMLYALAGVDDIRLLAICIFFATLGLIQMDVMADTMVVERSKFEDNSQRGQLQTTCYSLRFAGGFVGALMGIYFSSHVTVKHGEPARVIHSQGYKFHEVVFVQALVPILLIFPLLFFLKEKYLYYKGPLAIEDEESSEMIPVTGSMSCYGTLKKKILLRGKKSSVLSNTTTTSTSTSTSITETTPFLASTSDSDSNSIEMESIVGDDATDADSKNKTQFEIYGVRDEIRKVDENEALLMTTWSGGEEVLSVSVQLKQIWETVQRPVVFAPLGFVYCYNILQVPNVAWQSYLQLALHFPPYILGLTVTIGSFMTLVGILAFKYYFFHESWRRIYIFSTCLTSFFSLTQVMLIFQINTEYLHIGNFFFSVGDDVIQQFISGIQFIPVCILYMRLCPEGSEGASYSMLTTFGNIALVCANNVGNVMSRIWDVSNDAMREQDYSGLWRLTVLTSLIAVVPLCLLFLLPKDREEQENLGQSKERSSTGGYIFLLVLFSSIGWSLTEAYIVVMDAHGRSLMNPVH